MTTEQNVPPPPVPAGYCRICGTPLSAEAQKVAFGTVYCAEHLPAAETTGSPWTAPPTVPPPFPALGNQSGSPGLAFLLGLLPGVGAIYNAQYAKGLVHVLIFGMLISLLNSRSVGDFEPLIGMLLTAWVFYQAFEAYHTARRRQTGEAVDEFSGLATVRAGQGGFPVGPVVLIGLGVIFLLHNFELLRLADLFKFWPLGLIGAGVSLLYRRLRTAPDPGSAEARREQ